MERKIDIGCLDQDHKNPDYLGIDNGSMDWDMTKPDAFADAEALPFKDESIDEVFSCLCLGYYADVYDSVRVLKVGGKIQILAHVEASGKVIEQLLESGVKIMELNGWNTEPDDYICDVRIIGIKGNDTIKYVKRGQV